jgi:hypothetical protein
MESTAPTTPTPTEQPAQQFSPMDISVVDQNSALNAMVAFLNVGQRRGAFSMDESAKVWEAVKFFIVPNTSAPLAPVVEEMTNDMESTD